MTLASAKGPTVCDVSAASKGQPVGPLAPENPR
jgi:hypothetical protein